MKSKSQIQYDSFQNRLGSLSDEELIQAFNKEVGNTGWVSARGVYLSVIRKEFERRNFDYSLIGDERSLSLAKSVELKDGKLHV